jgi:hypothetical protein
MAQNLYPKITDSPVLVGEIPTPGSWILEQLNGVTVKQNELGPKIQDYSYRPLVRSA